MSNIAETRRSARTSLTGRERLLGERELIVSKTDSRGVITYVNDVFLNISGYTEGDMIGAPHSVIRHPHMPRCVFKLLWDTVQKGDEIFAYVVNRAKCGDHYWVFAHVTPCYSSTGALVGYHSNRRAPKREAIAAVTPLYEKLRQIEGGDNRSKEGMEEATRYLLSLLADKGLSYDEFVLSL